MFHKRLFFITKFLLILGISLSMPLISLAAFKDIPKTHPQFDAINGLEIKKILVGFPDGTFRPEKTMTKAEFLKLVFSDIDFKPTAKKYLTGFKDVPIDSWFAGYVKKAVELKLINPPQVNPVFGPEKAFTKTEALQLTFQIEGIPTPYKNKIDQKDLFDDVKPNAPFAYIALAAKANGIVSSKNPKLFTPFKNLTRGDAAEMVYQSQLVRQGKNTQNTITIAPSEESFTGLDPLSAQFVNNPKFPMLLDVWKKANTNYYYQDKINENEILYGAIEGMVNKLDDPYSVFQEPLEASELNDYLQGELQGIGIKIEVIEKQLVISGTLPNSPAEKSGLKSGDIIDKIDDKKVSDMTLENVLKLIKGKAGTSVHLSIIRQGTGMEFNILREKISISSVSSKILDGNIAYINIMQFTQNTATDFDKQLQGLLNSKPKGFIIDLRGNPGGYFDISNKVMDHFIATGKIIVSTKTAKNEKTDYTSKGPGELSTYPTIVIINELTASAGEIMAGALQDYKIARLLGEKSFGKGSVQQLYNYKDTSILKLSTAHWLTPLGKDVHDIGLQPDIAVARTKEDILAGKDPQLERAISELQK